MAISKTELAATSQKLVASVLQVTLKENAMLIPTISDYSSWAQPGSDEVSIIRRDQFAAADKTEETDLTVQDLTFTADKLLLDKHKAIYTELERFGQVQSNVNAESEILMEQAKELALQVDKDLIVALRAASAAAPDHIIAMTGTGAVISQTDILEFRRLLNVQSVPQEDRTLLISNDQEKAMLAIPSFVEVDKYGPGAQPINSAELGRIYGFRVLRHNEMVAAEAFAYHKSAVAYGTQLNPEFKTDENLKGIKKEYLLHMIYGVKTLDSGKRQVVGNATGA